MIIALSAASCLAITPITQQELVRGTQELYEAVAPGYKTPWQKYYAADAIYCDGTAHKMDKEALLEDLKPLPAGLTGHIEIKARISAESTILSYYAGTYEVAPGRLLFHRDGHGQVDELIDRRNNEDVVYKRKS
jgi:hypothetical protein